MKKPQLINEKDKVELMKSIEMLTDRIIEDSQHDNLDLINRLQEEREKSITTLFENYSLNGEQVTSLLEHNKKAVKALEKMQSSYKD